MPYQFVGVMLSSSRNALLPGPRNWNANTSVFKRARILETIRMRLTGEIHPNGGNRNQASARVEW